MDFYGILCSGVYCSYFSFWLNLDNNYGQYTQTNMHFWMHFKYKLLKIYCSKKPFWIDTGKKYTFYAQYIFSVILLHEVMEQVAGLHLSILATVSSYAGLFVCFFLVCVPPLPQERERIRSLNSQIYSPDSTNMLILLRSFFVIGVPGFFFEDELITLVCWMMWLSMNR
jgi:hypothetical protein